MADKPVLTREERRAKREARRVKQREANIGRAAKMHQARLEAGQQAVLSPATTHRLARSSKRWRYRGCRNPGNSER